jgi:hypothetical protein
MAAVPLAASAALVWAGGPGFPVERPHLLSGAAWLASSSVGQLTLLDGSSAEVAAQVQVAPAGNRLTVAQQATHAYVVDRTAGSVRRVDGASFAVTAPVTPLPRAGAGLTAFAGPDAVYVLDTDRGVLAVVDPRALAARRKPVTMSARVTPRASTMDGTGRLWILDDSSGDLVWVDGGQRRVRRGAVRPGTGFLTLAGGQPVLVDTERRTANSIDPASGAVATTTALDLRPGDHPLAAGTTRSRRLYLLTARGSLSLCDLSAPDCPDAVPVTPAGADLGAPVESAGRVFVPDYGTGRVWIVDVAQAAVVAEPRVLDPKVRFDLLVRDGVVFFNDPDSEHAGVIRLDGGVRHIAKYDPTDPSRGLGGPPRPTPTTTAPPPSAPSTPSVPAPPSGPAPPSAPAQPDASPAPPAGPGPAPADHAVRITASATTALVGQAVTFRVYTTVGPAPAGTHWVLGDGQEADSATVSHSWAAPGTYQVSVQATFADGQARAASVTVQVQPKPVTVTVNLVAVTGSYIGVCNPPSDATTYQVRISVSGGPVTVRYRVVNNTGGGSDTSTKSLFFSGTGPQTQTATHHESAYLSGNATDGTLTAEVTAPVTVRSATAPYHLSCTGPVLGINRATPSPPDYAGPCPHQVTYEVNVTIPGGNPLTFTYKWFRQSRGSGGAPVETVTGTGTVRLTHTETVTASTNTGEKMEFLVTGPPGVPRPNSYMLWSLTVRCT